VVHVVNKFIIYLINIKNRIREDTAKYLINLDPNAPYYDPKSRSLRENPNPYAEK
jgi:hypothetical protein